MTRMQRLKDAIEGECDGLAITDDRARAILEFLDAEGAQAKPAEAVAWLHHCQMIGGGNRYVEADVCDPEHKFAPSPKPGYEWKRVEPLYVSPQPAEVPALRQALEELVACKDLKERLVKLAGEPPDGEGDNEHHAISNEYRRRMPLAWEAARAALALPRVSAEVPALTDALALAIRFHETYERLAPSFGYETRPDTKVFDPESKNGKLMVAVCAALAPQLKEGGEE